MRNIFNNRYNDTNDTNFFTSIKIRMNRKIKFNEILSHKPQHTMTFLSYILPHARSKITIAVHWWYNALLTSELNDIKYVCNRYSVHWWLKSENIDLLLCCFWKKNTRNMSKIYAKEKVKDTQKILQTSIFK